jgi:hypothetical protein
VNVLLTAVYSTAIDRKSSIYHDGRRDNNAGTESIFALGKITNLSGPSSTRIFSIIKSNLAISSCAEVMTYSSAVISLGAIEKNSIS